MKEFKLLLDIKNINKSFNGIPILKDVSFKIPTSSILTICGHSGVGKSTLLSIVSGMQIPDRGKVVIDSIQMNSINNAILRKKYMGIFFQNNNLLNELTVEDNLLLPQIINNVPNLLAFEKVDYLLNLFNLLSLKQRFPYTLSRGEYQRIGLLRAIANDPKIVVADEPTASLDEKNCELLLDLIVKLNRDLEITFLIASHDVRFTDISNETYKLFDGILTKNE